MSLTVRTDRDLIRASASSTRYLWVSFTASAAPRRTERMPVNVAFVLDRSGSMAGQSKLPIARTAVQQALRMLRPEDRFALVVYDNEIDMLMPSTLASAEARQTALRALAAIEPRGSTDLCGGWLRGCEQIAVRLEAEQVGRCLLVTDGLANYGITSHGEIVRHAAELRRRGITTSTLGVGEDFDERLLRDMAQEGGGNAYYVERAEQIMDLLTSELGEALETVMRDAAIHVALPANAQAGPLNTLRYTHIAGDNELRVELGNLVSEQEVSAVIRVRFPHGTLGDRTTVRVSLNERTNDVSVPSVELGWTYASHRENDVQLRDRDVDVEVATLYAARARADATELNRRGDYVGAQRVLERTAARILEYAQGDARLLRIAGELQQEFWQYGAEMSPVMLKQAFYSAEAATKFRGVGGKARRRAR